MPHTTVNLKVDRDGTVTLFTGAAEIGQGSDTIQVQLVAEELGVRPERVKLIAADTELTPVDLGSYSSRVTFMAGNACLDAARKLKLQILEAAAAKFGRPPEELVSREGKIFLRSDPRTAVSFDEAVKEALDRFGVLGSTGSYAPPEEARGGKFKGAGVGPSPSYSYSAQAAEVSVDV